MMVISFQSMMELQMPGEGFFLVLITMIAKATINRENYS